MEKVLVTGGAGFIGSNLVDILLLTKFVVIVDDLSMGNINNIPVSKNVEFIEGSVTDSSLMDSIFKKYEFDYIFHLAAVASVAESIVKPIETHEVNQNATLYLLDLAKKQKKLLKKFVFSSSAAVYGDIPSLPKTELSPIAPLSPYAIDKFASEQFTILYSNLYGMRTSAVRFFNVYGPRQNPKSPYSGIISILTDYFKNKVNSSDKFVIYGDGLQTRDFIYVQDVVEALIYISTSEESTGEVYNIATSKKNSLLDMIKIYENITGKSIELAYENERKGDIKHSFADISKLNKLGYSPKFNLENGLKEYWIYELKK